MTDNMYGLVSIYGLSVEEFNSAVKSLENNPLKKITRNINGVWQAEYKDGKRYKSYDNALTWIEVSQ